MNIIESLGRTLQTFSLMQEQDRILSEKLKIRYKEKWEKSKLLPRKAKKLMRKDALLDWQFSEMF